MRIAIKLLERLGFVRLRDFGLVITPERRVLSTRSSVLDDGLGGIVVGWVDNDLAAVELAAWGTKPSQPKPIALAFQPTQLAPTSQPAPAPLPSEVDMTDDEWEWEIAMARVRAASAVTPPVVAADDDMVTTVSPMDAITQITEWSSPAMADSPPRTIIPVPRLPPAVDARLVRPFDEVTRQVPAPSRFPRATMQRAAAANDDETRQTVVATQRSARR